MAQLLPIVAASACPSLYRLAPARDGGICRVKLRLGRMTLAQGRALAGAAGDFGNGIIEITNRGNVQLRGVAAGHAMALAGRLLAAGLGTSHPGADDISNVMVAPMAGFDAGQVVDMRPLADAILGMVQNETRYHALSPKFSVLVDGGEVLASTGHPHDVWLSAVRRGGETVVLLGLAGSLEQGAVAAVPLAQAQALVRAVLDSFLALRGPEMVRMRDLVGAIGVDGVVDAIAAREGFALDRSGWVGDWRRTPARERAIGLLPQLAGGVSLGAKPALGRMDPELLLALVAAAERAGGAALHLTPWQSLLVPDIAPSQAEALRDALAGLGLITDAALPLATIVACSGSAGCGKGLAAVQADALRLAGMLGETGVAGLHLSGCAKSCALAHAAPFTLVGIAQGRYDLYSRAAGSASRFGGLVAGDIDLDRAAAHLAAG